MKLPAGQVDALARELADHLWDGMPEHPDAGDVVEVAGRVFCACVGAALVTLPTALAAVGHLWLEMYGKPGTRA